MSAIEHSSTHNVQAEIREGLSSAEKKAGFYLSEDGEWIPDEWSTISLKDALKFIVDNRGKTVPIEEKRSDSIALIATNCINNERLYPSYINVRWVSLETYATWFRAHPEPNDIILTNKGSKNGAICLVPEKVDFCIAQDMMALRVDTDKLTHEFLFATLRSKAVQNKIKLLNVDGVIPHFKKSDLNGTELSSFIGIFLVRKYC